MSYSEAKAGARLAELLALELGLAPEQAGQIRAAAALRDIGVQKIPATILYKPGKLTEADYQTVKNHTRIGAGLLSDIQGTLGEMARLITEFHHEW